MSQSAVTIDPRDLERIYVWDDRSEVITFLQRNPFRMPLLLDVGLAIPTYFPGARLLLDVAVDPEAPDDEQLVLSVVSRLATPEAFETLHRFDEEWWLDRLSGAQDKVTITLSFE